MSNDPYPHWYAPHFVVIRHWTGTPPQTLPDPGSEERDDPDTQHTERAATALLLTGAAFWTTILTLSGWLITYTAVTR